MPLISHIAEDYDDSTSCYFIAQRCRSGALFLWYIPADHGFWFPLDSGLFHFFNRALAKSEAFLWLVAITNNRAFDGCSLLAMGCLMLSFWLKEDKTGRRRILIIGFGDAADGRDYQPAGAASDAG